MGIDVEIKIHILISHIEWAGETDQSVDVLTSKSVRLVDAI